MSIIRPQVFPTPDSPTVQFREAPETVDLDREIPRILTQQQWVLGTRFSVQFVNHDRTELIKSARYIVTLQKQEIQTFNPDSQNPNTKTVEIRKAQRVEDWYYVDPKQAERPVVKWNPGAKLHEVRQGDKILFASKDKKEAEKFKEAA